MLIIIIFSKGQAELDFTYSSYQLLPVKDKTSCYNLIAGNF